MAAFGERKEDGRDGRADDDEDGDDILSFADAEYDDTYPIAKRQNAAIGYARMLEDYSLTNAVPHSTVEFTPGALPVASSSRRVPQCNVNTSSTNTDAECTTVSKVEIPSFQHRHN